MKIVKLFAMVFALSFSGLSDARTNAEQDEVIDEMKVDLLQLQNIVEIFARRENPEFRYKNIWYMDASASALRPVSSSFDFRADLGVGVSAGVGYHINKTHAVSILLDSDIFFGTTVLYTPMIHFYSPKVSLGPRLGGKFRLAKMRPFDNYINEAEDLPWAMGELGLQFELPVGANSIYAAVSYLTSSREIFVGRIGVKALGAF